jgi:hypothetical protein
MLKDDARHQDGSKLGRPHGIDGFERVEVLSRQKVGLRTIREVR